jgi:hypothetical protein
MGVDMLGLVKKLSAVASVLFVGLPLQMLVANAQQNPFVGTWSSTQASGSITAYVDYFENGTLHLSGPVSSPTGGSILHECGAYQFNPAQSTLQFVFSSYGPITPGEPGPLDLNQVKVLQYQFPNPDLLLFSDGSRYVRQPGNPWPMPRNGC